MLKTTLRRRRALALLGLLLATIALYGLPLCRGRVLAGRDVFRMSIPDCDFLMRCWRAGQLPLWTPFQRLGQPFAATLQSQAFYPIRWIALALSRGDPVQAPSLEHVLHIVLATVGAFLGCRRLGASFPSAATGAALFALGPCLTHLAIVPNMLSAAAWSGFILAAGAQVARAPGPTPAAKLAVSSAMSLLAGSPETWLWQAAVLVVPLALSRRRARATAWLAASVGGS